MVIIHLYEEASRKNDCARASQSSESSVSKYAELEHSKGRECRDESFNQLVMPMAYPLLYSPLRTGMPVSEREDSDACMSPMPE